jgi:hypothetical protein
MDALSRNRTYVFREVIHAALRDKDDQPRSTRAILLLLHCGLYISSEGGLREMKTRQKQKTKTKTSKKPPISSVHALGRNRTYTIFKVSAKVGE